MCRLCRSCLLLVLLHNQRDFFRGDAEEFEKLLILVNLLGVKIHKPSPDADWPICSSIDGIVVGRRTDFYQGVARFELGELASEEGEGACSGCLVDLVSDVGEFLVKAVKIPFGNQLWIVTSLEEF